MEHKVTECRMRNNNVGEERKGSRKESIKSNASQENNLHFNLLIS